MGFISLGLQSGAKTYQSISITDINIELSPTSTYGKKFIVDGESIDANVGTVSTYERVSKLNENTITMVFDYDINNVRLYAKPRQSTGETTQVQKATISADKRTVTINYNLNPSLTDVYLLVFINGDVESEISIVNQVENTTYLVDENRLNLIADDGYIFDDSPKWVQNNITRSMKKVSDIEYYCDFDTDVDLILKGKTKKDVSKLIINQVENTTITIVEQDSNLLVTLIADDGYIFDGSPKFKNGVITRSMRKVSDIEYYCEVDTVDETLLTGVTKKVRIIKITGELINCSCNYSDGEVIDTNKRIEIKANKGYKFDGVYNFKIDNITKTMSKSDDGTLLYRDIKDFDIGNYELFDTYKATKEVERMGGFVNLYNPTDDELIELSKVRIIKNDSETIDLGQYITNLYILPFNVDELVSDRNTIILGDMDSKVETNLLNTYSMVIDLGNIEVIEKYNNVYDYINTDYILHLPFFNKIYLNSEYVVNETISLEIVIDLYSGVGVLNVYSSFTDEIIETRKETIATMIPFIHSISNNIIGSMSRSNNFISQAFIEVVRNKPYNVETIFGGETIEYGMIGEYEEFIKCDNIILNTKASNPEKEEIKQLLQRGVII